MSDVQLFMEPTISHKTGNDDHVDDDHIDRDDDDNSNGDWYAQLPGCVRCRCLKCESDGIVNFLNYSTELWKKRYPIYTKRIFQEDSSTSVLSVHIHPTVLYETGQ